MQTFTSLLQESFNNYPDKIAIRYKGQIITYRELERKLKGIVAILEEMDIDKGDRVILYSDKKIPFLITHLGIMFCGGISVPLNFNYTAEEMKYFINDSKARFVFSSGEHKEKITSIKPECKCVEYIFDLSIIDALCKCERYPAYKMKEEDICFMLYSSGTTGQPKGVAYSQMGVASSLLSLQNSWKFTSDDVLLNVLPLFHTHGLSFATHLALISGSTIIIEDKFKIEETPDLINKATVFMGVPTIYYDLLNYPEFAEKAKQWINTRLFTCGSAPIRTEILNKIENIIGKNLINRYGMTESHVLTSIPLDGPFKQGTVGKAIQGIELKIIDESKKILEVGKTGEVMIKSKNLFSYYWNKETETENAFDSNGFFHTGDLGFLDEDGFLTLVGRKTDLIIVDGFNVYPAVVEKTINEFPEIRESAVVGLVDERRGEKVVAFVVTNKKIDIEKLIDFCAKKLIYYQRPKQIQIIEKLPRNAMGKVLKKELK